MSLKKLLCLLVVAAAALIPFTSVAAVDLGGGYLESARDKAGYSQANEFTFAQTLGSIVQVALSFVGIIFLTLMVYAGFLWMTAKGDESKVDKAKEIIKAAIIGLVITLGAYSITAFVVPRVVEQTAQ